MPWKIPKNLLTAGRIVNIMGGTSGMKYHVRFKTKDLKAGVNPAHENWMEKHLPPNNNTENAPAQMPPPKGGYQYNDDVTVIEAGKVIDKVDIYGISYTTLAYRLQGLEPAPRGVYANAPTVPVNYTNGAESRNRRTTRIGAVPTHPRRGSTAGFGNGAPAAAPAPTTTRRASSPKRPKSAIRRHSTAGFGQTTSTRKNSPLRRRRGGTVVSPKNVGL